MTNTDIERRVARLELMLGYDDQMDPDEIVDVLAEKPIRVAAWLTWMKVKRRLVGAPAPLGACDCPQGACVGHDESGP